MKHRYAAACMTHGRGHLIGEAVESFLRQDGGEDLQMFIVNDCPEQPLTCAHPRLSIVNLPEPITDVSRKANITVEFTDADYVMWWEDDDISLPWRLSDSRAAMDRLDYMRQGVAFVFSDGIMNPPSHNLFFGSCCFRRDWFMACGGSEEGVPCDVSADHRMRSPGGRHAIITETRMPYFVYKWGRPDVHHDSTVAGTNADRFKAFREATLRNPAFIPGPVEIVPGWKYEYTDMAREVMR